MKIRLNFPYHRNFLSLLNCFHQTTESKKSISQTPRGSSQVAGLQDSFAAGAPGFPRTSPGLGSGTTPAAGRVRSASSHAEPRYTRKCLGTPEGPSGRSASRGLGREEEEGAAAVAAPGAGFVGPRQQQSDRRLR